MFEISLDLGKKHNDQVVETFFCGFGKHGGVGWFPRCDATLSTWKPTGRVLDVRHGDRAANLDGGPHERPLLGHHVQPLFILHGGHGKNALPHAIENFAVLGLITPAKVGSRASM